MFKKLLLTFLTLLVPFALASCEPRYFDDVKVAKIKDIYNMEAKTPVAASGILYRAASKSTWYLTDGTSTIKVYDKGFDLDADPELNYDFKKALVKGTVSEFGGVKQIAISDYKLNEKSKVVLPENTDISQLKLFASKEKGKAQVAEDFAKLEGKLVKFDAKILGFKETYFGKAVEGDKIMDTANLEYIELKLQINGEDTNVRLDVREAKWAKWFKQNIAAIKALYKDIQFTSKEKKNKKGDKIEKTYVEYTLAEAKLVFVTNVIASVYRPYDKVKKQLVGTSFAQFDITTKFTIAYK